MVKVILTIIVLVILAGIILFTAATSHDPKTAKRATWLTFGLIAAMWICGCAKPENDGDVAIIIASQGTVFKTEILDSGHCNAIINTDSGLVISILKKNLDSCKKFKKGDKVKFDIILQPSPLMPGDIKKL
ncbi:MAG: hypothetical protein Q7S81_01995 [bacterium]|nr:hypothetical protein [bacterium]